MKPSIKQFNVNVTMNMYIVNITIWYQSPKTKKYQFSEENYYALLDLLSSSTWHNINPLPKKIESINLIFDENRFGNVRIIKSNTKISVEKALISLFFIDDNGKIF